MELEYKWNMPSECDREALAYDGEIAGHVASQACVHMHATYYDTSDHEVRDMHGGLRLRSENGESICCLKLAAGGDAACKSRQEYEVEAADIVEGLRLLPNVGAPRKLCERLACAGVCPTCETQFERNLLALSFATFAAELAFDVGELRCAGRSAPIHEIELELVSGDEGAFHAFAHALQARYGLVPQPLSKLARAMALTPSF